LSTSDSERLHVNLARLSASRTHWLWTVVKCVCCGRSHAHGGGRISESPFDYLTCKGAHCLGAAGQYVLRVENLADASRLVASARRRAASKILRRCA
jgi:hypothetical protein